MSSISGRSSLPRAVQLALIRKGLTITEVASRIGKSKATVSLVLRGKLRADETAGKIAGILGLPPKRIGRVDAPAHSRTPFNAESASSKGARDALLLAFDAPSRCVPADVDILMDRIKSAALPLAGAPNIVPGLRKR